MFVVESSWGLWGVHPADSPGAISEEACVLCSSDGGLAAC